MIDDTVQPWRLENAQQYACDVLRGNRVRLRGLRESDLGPLIAWRSDAAAGVLQSDTVNPFAEQPAEQILRSHASGPGLATRRGFAVESAGSPESEPRLIGFVTLSDIEPQHRSAEFAIALDPDSGGHGYGVDATRTMVRYGFRELGLRRVWLTVWAYNGRAIATYRKAGFIEEGRLRDAVFHDRRWHDQLVMSAISTDPGWLD